MISVWQWFRFKNSQIECVLSEDVLQDSTGEVQTICCYVNNAAILFAHYADSSPWTLAKYFIFCTKNN